MEAGLTRRPLAAPLVACDCLRTRLDLQERAGASHKELPYTGTWGCKLKCGNPQLGWGWRKAEGPEQPFSNFLSPTGASGVLLGSPREVMVKK